jgi:hypothetical protein
MRILPMNTKRFLFATAIAMATAACSADVTAPDPAVRAPASGAVTDESPTTVPVPTVVDPEEEEDDSGTLGSGVGR